MRTAVSTLALLVLLVFPPRLMRAQDAPPAIVLVPGEPGSPEHWPEAEQRVRAELAAMGFSVIEARGAAGAGRLAELKRAARARAAHAALHLRRGVHGGVEVWLVDEVTGKASYRRVRVPGAGPEAVAQVALRTVELLNASLLELRAAHFAEQRSAPPLVQQLVEGSLDEPRVAGAALAFGAGPVVVGTPAGAGPLLGLSLDARWFGRGAFGLGLAVLAAPIGTALEGEPGMARIGLGGARLAGLYRVHPARAVETVFGLGAGALVAWARPSGSVADAYAGRTDAAVVPSAVASAALLTPLGERVRLQLGVSAGVSLREVAIVLGGQPETQLGRPLLEATLGIEWIALERGR